MKKQYLIGLLGLTAIAVPMGNSLLTTHPTEITPIYEDNGLDTGITIENDSNVGVLDNDHNGEASAGDTIDEIYFHTTFEMPDPVEFKVIQPKDTGLNIYEEGEQEEPIWSETYKSITELDSDRHDGPALTIDVNSKENPSSWLWIQELKDDSTKFMVTAEGIEPNSGQTIDDLTENYVGEINITSIASELKPTIEITSGEDVLTTPTTAKVDYKITSGTDVDGKPVEYPPESVEWINVENNNDAFETTITNEATIDGVTTGTITANNLIGDKEYPTTMLSTTMSDGITTADTGNIPFETPTGQSNSKITSAEASNQDKFSTDIDYNIALGTNADNSPAEVTKITLTDDGDKDNVLYESDETLTQPNENGDGTISVEELKSDHTYSTTLTIETTEGSNPIKEGIAIQTLTAKTPSTITSAEASNQDKFSTDIDYNIALGTNADNSPAEVTKITLTDDGDKDNVLYESDETLTQPNENGDGTISVEELKSDHTYSTTLTIETTEGSNPTKEGIAIQTLTAKTPSKITSAEASNQDKFSTDIDYNIALGTNADNSPAEVTKITLTDDGDKDNVLYKSDKTLAQPDENGDGTISVDSLESNHTYSTTLTIETTEGSNPTKEGIVIQTLTAETPSTITSASALKQDKFSTDIDYNIALGTNADNSPATVTEITLTDEANEGVLYKSDKTLEQPDDEGNGTISVEELESDHTYSTTLTIETTEGSNPAEKGIAVQTLTAEEDSTIKINGVETEDTSATINYDVELGKTSTYDDITFDQVEWIDTDNDVTIAKEESPQAIEGNTYSLKTSEELKANTPYHTKLVLTLSGVEQEITVDEFTTKEHASQEDSTMVPTLNKDKTTATSVTFDYVATEGTDAYGDAYNLTTIQIVDSEGNEMAILNNEEGLKLEGSIIVEDLTADTTYDGWTMISTFTNSNADHDDDIIEANLEEVLTLKDASLGVGAIIGIIAAVLLIIAALAAGLTYLANKAKPNKA